MTRRTVWLFLPLGSVAALIVAVASAESPPAPTSLDSLTIEQLIEHLDSDDFETREAATKALLHRADALPALRRAAHSERPEVHRRAGLILAEREDRAIKQGLDRLMANAKNGEVDQLVERMALLEDHLDERTWQAIVELADRIVARSTRSRASGFQCRT